MSKEYMTLASEAGIEELRLRALGVSEEDELFSLNERNRLWAENYRNRVETARHLSFKNIGSRIPLENPSKLNSDDSLEFLIPDIRSSESYTNMMWKDISDKFGDLDTFIGSPHTQISNLHNELQKYMAKFLPRVKI